MYVMTVCKNCKTPHPCDVACDNCGFVFGGVYPYHRNARHQFCPFCGKSVKEASEAPKLTLPYVTFGEAKAMREKTK